MYDRRSRRKVTKKRNNGKRPVSRQQVAKICKNVLLKTSEPKTHIQTTYSLLNPTGYENLYHNQSHMVGGWANLMRTIPGLENTNGKTTGGVIPAPFEAGSRIGESINIKGLSIKMLFQLPVDRSSVILRIFVLKGQDYHISASFPIIWKQDAGLTNNVIMDAVDTAQQKIVAAKTITLNHPPTMTHSSHAHSTTTERLVKMWIPFKNMKYTYSSVGGTEHHGDGKSQDYCLSIAAYDRSGALITDVVAKVFATSTLYFRDP
ncbi:hypothetical protein ES705_41424 [subsurface metagenome]